MWRQSVHRGEIHFAVKYFGCRRRSIGILRSYLHEVELQIRRHMNERGGEATDPALGQITATVWSRCENRADYSRVAMKMQSIDEFANRCLIAFQLLWRHCEQPPP